jgi:hypothetical protein
MNYYIEIIWGAFRLIEVSEGGFERMVFDSPDPQYFLEELARRNLGSLRIPLVVQRG